jgi:adenosylcobinamide-phosphate synthase
VNAPLVFARFRHWNNVALSSIISTWFVLASAVGLDAVLGDPSYRYHPVRVIGSFAVSVERALWRPEGGRIRGFLAWFIVVALCGGLAAALHCSARYANRWLGHVVDVWLIYFTIAARDLGHHAQRVMLALEAENLDEARRAVGCIVGRDTDILDQAEICRATVETVAESTVDGVTAPLFWATLLGPIGAVLYRAINTLDSMWGHRDEHYERFGCVAARCDDAANYIPARLTVGWVTIAAFVLRYCAGNSWRFAWQHGPRHASPNSGLSEAAFAGALDVTLGGANRYSGEWLDGPRFGASESRANPQTIRQSVRLMWVTTGIAAAMLCSLLAIVVR